MSLIFLVFLAFSLSELTHTHALSPTPALGAELSASSFLSDHPGVSFAASTVRPYSGSDAVAYSSSDTVDTWIPTWLQLSVDSEAPSNPTSLDPNSKPETRASDVKSAVTTAPSFKPMSSTEVINPNVNITAVATVSSLTSGSTSKIAMSNLSTAAKITTSTKPDRAFNTSNPIYTNSTTRVTSSSTLSDRSTSTSQILPSHQSNSTSVSTSTTQPALMSQPTSTLRSTSLSHSSSTIQPTSTSQSTSMSQPSPMPMSTSPIQTSSEPRNPFGTITVGVTTTVTFVSTVQVRPVLNPNDDLTLEISSMLLTSDQQTSKDEETSSTYSTASSTDDMSSHTSESTTDFGVLAKGQSSLSVKTSSDLATSQLETSDTDTQPTAIHTLASNLDSDPVADSNTLPCPQATTRTSSITETIISTILVTCDQSSSADMSISRSSSAPVITKSSSLWSTSTKTEFVTVTPVPDSTTLSIDMPSSDSVLTKPVASDSFSPSDTALTSVITQLTTSITTYWSILSSSNLSDSAYSHASTSTTLDINLTSSTSSTTASTSLPASAPTSYTSTSQSSTSSATTTSNLQTVTSVPRYRGFNLVNESPLGPHKWKNGSEWDEAFRRIKALSNDFNAIRLYSTTDGDARHLRESILYARSHNLSIHVGVWSGGDPNQARFALEKSALEDALAEYGCDNIIAVSVGNEDMYNNHRLDGNRIPLTDVMLLVKQVQDVMDVLDQHGCCDVQVTHTDTFGDWLNTTISEPLIRQVDFLTVNIFPYWEGRSIEDAGRIFWQHVNNTRDMAMKYGKDIWIGETGWPINGQTMSNEMSKAVPGIDNMRRYWEQIGCDLMNNMSAFWYVEWDASAPTSFGLTDLAGKSIIGDLNCA